MEGIPKWPTFGVKFKKKISFSAQRKTGILYYLLDVIRATLNYDSSEYVRNKDKIRTIEIEIDRDISATDFKKSKESIDYLYNKGYEATLNFIDQWNFNAYIRTYRTNETR
ncbi:hypothetical protein [Clostridium oryzae]|uniref:Uncharacterized protein n=1 Tax=Clostridium oryzae TaxID=1450648 RepID=A0A1V4IMC2_9CLOT|nr:hypothetical protein [Clostridium oryzae]OPJ60994.1 hypothetical protein CLORY_25430 [Clostridium oryzae]